MKNNQMEQLNNIMKKVINTSKALSRSAGGQTTDRNHSSSHAPNGWRLLRRSC